MITVSIVSYNTKELLEGLLESLLRQRAKEKVEIVVVDNNSTDGSVEMLEERFKSKVKTIKNSENLGFAKAQNLVLKNFKSDFFLVLNPDVEIGEDCIEKMIEFVNKNPKCGIASCKILDFEGKLQSNGGDFPEGASLINWLFNTDFLNGSKNFHRQEVEYFAEPHQVDWVGGTFMVLKKELIEKTRGFNEKYFMYFEDVEFCYTAWKNGFEVWLNPDVTIKHKSGASSKDPRFKQWKGEFQGLIYYYAHTLNKGLSGFVVSSIIRLLVYKAIILRILAFGLLGKFDYAKTYAKVFINI